jgi:hypothetical protein
MCPLLYPIPLHESHLGVEDVSERKRIEERLRKKQAEVTALEEKIKAAKVYINALQDVLKMIGRDADDVEEPEAKLRPGSSVAQAREAILARGEPMHLDDLLGSMGKDVNQSNKASLGSSLAAYVRDNEIFCRTAPNTFGLIELGHQDAPEETEEEPPAGFGRAPVAASFDTDLDEDVPF